MYDFIKVYNKMLNETRADNPKIPDKDKKNPGSGKVDDKKELGIAGTDVIEDDDSEYIEYEKPKVSDKEKKNKGKVIRAVPGDLSYEVVKEGWETNTQRRDKMTPKDLLSALEKKGLKGAKMSGKNLYIGNIESGVDLTISADGRWYLES